MYFFVSPIVYHRKFNALRSRKEYHKRCGMPITCSRVTYFCLLSFAVVDSSFRKWEKESKMVRNVPLWLITFGLSFEHCFFFFFFFFQYSINNIRKSLLAKCRLWFQRYLRCITSNSDKFSSRISLSLASMKRIKIRRSKETEEVE